jgi:pimeloyl-ACP methyl ester carboxylesterase
MPAATRLRYLEALPTGTDRPRGTLVLIHAFPLNARMWEPQLAIAHHGWRVVAPQLRGVDGDQNPPASSVDEYAGEVIDLMDALEIHEAVIGGLSMGGYVTLAMFRHAPTISWGWSRRPRPQADRPRASRGAECCGWSEKGASAIADDASQASE